MRWWRALESDSSDRGGTGRGLYLKLAGQRCADDATDWGNCNGCSLETRRVHSRLERLSKFIFGKENPFGFFLLLNATNWSIAATTPRLGAPNACRLIQ